MFFIGLFALLQSKATYRRCCLISTCKQMSLNSGIRSSLLFGHIWHAVTSVQKDFTINMVWSKTVLFGAFSYSCMCPLCLFVFLLLAMMVLEFLVHIVQLSSLWAARDATELSSFILWSVEMWGMSSSVSWLSLLLLCLLGEGLGPGVPCLHGIAGDWASPGHDSYEKTFGDAGGC